MKKIFLFGLMAAVAMLATSCVKDLQDNQGGEAVVSFNVATPEIATKAFSDGTTATVLQYAVYDEEGVELEALTKTDATINNGSTTVELQLTTGNTYSVIFWAAAEEAPYTVDFGAKTMTVDYDGALSNDEARDAFYAYKEFTVKGAQTETIELRRPFAQLNIGTADYTASTNAGYTPTKSAVTVKNIYSSLNLATGAVDNAAEVTFGSADIKKDETFPVTGHEYLAMNYLLVASDKEVVDVEFTYTNGADAKTRTVGSVPVQRNHRTNIYGNLLTSEVDINVEIKPEYDEPSYNTDLILNIFDLQKALDEAPENATTIINLGADIKGDVTDVQKPGRKVIIDGHKCKYNGSIKVHSNSNQYPDAALTIKNLKFETSKASVNFIEALENGAQRYSCNITVENCTFTATGDAVKTAVGVQIKSSKNAKVIGCTATNMHSLIQAQSCDESVLVKDCTVNGKNGVAFKQVKSAVVEGTTITATAYGIRFDGNTDNYGITVKDNNVTAAQPFIVRKMTGKDNTITLEGTNTLTTDATYQIVITNGSDDEAYVVPTGTYTLTGADDYVVYPAIENYDAFIAKISDDTWYDATKTELAIEDVADFAAFVETANSGNDFDGKTLKLTGDIDLYFKDVTALADGDPVTFRPIGDTKYNGGKPFKGTFDGQGHTIKNLYQNGWDLGYQWGVYGSYGLFGSLDGATVKNVVIEGSESYIEGGDVSFIAGSATGDCVFENITINSGVAATYNNGCGGIIGWSGAGNYTFKNITIGEDAVLGGLWGSFDSSIGGIVGQAEPGATYNFENVTINGRIDAYNDCTASYDYYNYRMCGMVIGRCEETTTIDGRNYPDLSKYNLSFNNVVVNYGDWMNYHYCRRSGERAVRIEPGYAYGGAENRDHSNDDKHCMEWIPFNQLIGGDQYNVKGLPAVDGVTVNYPASYRREVSTAAALTEALGKGVSVILATDIDFGSTQLAITGENQVVDLGGHALTTANNWGGISLKNGATIKNGTITHAGNTAAIKAFNGSSVENVTINATCATADKTVTGIAVQQGANVESIKNVTINGVSQGIEVGYQATVGLIENAVVNESNNGTAKGIGLVINGGKVGKAKDCTFKGETYGITMHLKGVFAAGLELENCTVEGTTASIYAWDEKGISNTSGSLVLTYDAATTLTGPFVWDFEDECQSVVTLNQPQ